MRRTRLDSGLRVVTETLPGAALRGGRLLGGHRLARRARRRSPAPATSSSTCCSRAPRPRDAAEIAEAVESVGGDMNAFTAQEVTAFYVRVPDQRLALALDILSDIVWSARAARRRGRVRAPGDPRRDPDARRHARRPRARPVRGGAVPRPPARARGRRARRRRSRRWRATTIAEYHADALPARQRRGRGGRQPRPRRRSSRWSRPRVADRRPAPGPTASAAPTRADSAPLARVERPTRAGAPRARHARRCAATTPTATRSAVAQPGARRRHVRRGCSRRCASSAASRTPCTRTAARSRRPARSAVYARHRARAGRRDCSTSSRGELDRLVADGGVTERELDGAKGHLTGSLALSLESSSSRMHRIGRSELTHGRDPDARRGGRSRSRRSPPTTSRGSSTACSATARAPWPWSGPSEPLDRASDALARRSIRVRR